MIEHVWTVICSSASIDRDTNNVSLQNVLEQITVYGEPVEAAMLPIYFEVVTLWALADLNVPSHGHARLTVVSPSGHTLGEPTEVEVDLSEHHRRRQRVRFPGLPIPEAGRYVFLVEFQNEGETEWHRAAAVPLEVCFQLPQAN